mgnify:CR=1 FL=1
MHVGFWRLFFLTTIDGAPAIESGYAVAAGIQDAHLCGRTSAQKNGWTYLPKYTKPNVPQAVRS